MSGQDHFGPYTLVSPLAQTGISVSHAVQIEVRPRIERLATLTLVQSSLTSQPEFADALLRAVQETELLNHPNISKVFDYGARDGHHYLVSEFIEGTSLQELLDHPGLTDDMAVYIVSQLAIAVAHAHARRSDDGQKVEVIHGDIRPAHVQITDAGAIKLIGYALGSARAALGADPAASGQQPADLFAYTEPAQARGEAPTANSDLFSLAALLWSLLARTPLFPGANAQETQASAKAGDIPSLLEQRPDIDAELASIVMNALGVEDADGRPIQNAQSLRSALSSWTRTRGSALGRPQVKAAFADAFPTDAPWGKTRPLTAREFTANDPHSLLHTTSGDIEDPGISTSFEALWSATPSAAKPATAPTAPAAPKPAPKPAAPTPTAPAAPPASGSSHAVTTGFAPVDIPEELPSFDDDKTVEYSQLEENEDHELILDLETDLVDDDLAVPHFDASSFEDDATEEYSGEDLRQVAPPIAPPKRFDGPPTREVPAAKLPGGDSASEKPGLAALLAASRASQALRGGQDIEETPSTKLPPRSAQPASGRSVQHTPSVDLPGLPPPRKPQPQPQASPKKKGSIQLDDIRPSDEAFATTSEAPRPAPAERPVVSAQRELPPTNVAAAPQTPIAPEAPQTSAQPVEAPPADTAPSDAPVADASAVQEPTQQATTAKPAVEHAFDPTAIYDEETAVVDYTDSYEDDYPAPTSARKKKGTSPAIIGLIVVVVLLLGYIVYSNLSGDSSAATSEAPVALRIESTPGRAHIFLDGEDTGEVTPHTFDTLAAGSKVSIHVARSGYEDSDAKSIDLEGGSVHTERFDLVSLKHTINLSSDPEGATVYIDGEEHGTTPTVVGPIEANPTLGVNIHLQLKGHRPRAIQHTWTGAERTSDVNITLDPL